MGAASIEYDGTSVEGVANGMKEGAAGSNGSTTESVTGSATGSTTGATTGAGTATGAGAGIFGLATFFFGFVRPHNMMAAPASTPMQQQHRRAVASSHSQSGAAEPQEPDVVQPALRSELRRLLTLEPSLSDADFKDAEESPPEEDEEESHGVTVVVTTVVARWLAAARVLQRCIAKANRSM